MRRPENPLVSTMPYDTSREILHACREPPCPGADMADVIAPDPVTRDVLAVFENVRFRLRHRPERASAVGQAGWKNASIFWAASGEDRRACIFADIRAAVLVRSNISRS